MISFVNTNKNNIKVLVSAKTLQILESRYRKKGDTTDTIGTSLNLTHSGLVSLMVQATCETDMSNY